MQVNRLQVAICFLLIVTTAQSSSADDSTYASMLLKSIDIQHPKYFVRVYESEVKEKGGRSEENQWDIVSSEDILDTSSGNTTRVAYVRQAEIHANNNIVIEFDRAYIRRLGKEFEGNIQITAKLLRRGKSRAIEIPGYYEIGQDTTAVIASARSARELAAIVDKLLFLYNLLQAPYEEFRAVEKIARDTLREMETEIPKRDFTDSLKNSRYSEKNTLYRQYARVERNISEIKTLLEFLTDAKNFSLLNALAKNTDSSIGPVTIQNTARQILKTDLVDLMSVYEQWEAKIVEVKAVSWQPPPATLEPPRGYKNLYLGFHFRLKSLALLLPYSKREYTDNIEDLPGNETWEIKYDKIIVDSSRISNLLDRIDKSLLAELADTHINLRAIGAESGDEIRVTITNLVNEKAASRPLIVSLKVRDLNGHVFLVDSILMLKRLGIDSAATAQGIADVNFQPTPGTTFGYVWWNRSTFWRCLRPGLGVNVSFPKFDAESVDITAGGTFSLFSNMIHITLGSCLTCREKRAYWGLGFSFTNIVSRLNGGRN